MKKLKKILRLLGVVLMIILAVAGIGIIGGAPIPTPRKKENTIEIRTELVEEKGKEKDNVLFKAVE